MTRPTPTETRRYPLGLTLVYCDGLARAGEQVILDDRAVVPIGYEERLFPGGALEDPRMSQRHATLGFAGGRWTLVDRGSKAGTFVAGQRVSEHGLRPGEVIKIESTFLVFGHIAPGQRSLMLNSVGAAMAVVEERVAQVARGDQPVLLLGENGTGKELVAHELHRLSGRMGPFLALNCASLGGDKLESALFGAEHGKFLRARKGTVFLDEVGEMEHALQLRLLRMLETGALRPDGTSEEIPIEARLIVSTNRGVDEFLDSEHMLPELYARLSSSTVKLPALRDRREDLGVLVRVLLGRGSARLDITPGLMAALLSAHWPLNIRGLIDVLNTARASQPKASRLDLDAAVRVALEAQLYVPVAGSSPSLDLRKPF